MNDRPAGREVVGGRTGWRRADEAVRAAAPDRLIAIRTKSILGILRAKYLVLELLSGLLIPTTLFPQPFRSILFASPFPHINFTPAALYLGKATGFEAARLLLLQAGWTVVLLGLGHSVWRRSSRRITIQGG